MLRGDLKFETVPANPGVYHFLDEDGLVLYVGKAKNLRNRLRQYFLKELGRGPAIYQMVEKAKEVKWTETESEIEAVILEAEEIKRLKPKYNIRQKDDKSFLVIKISKPRKIVISTESKASGENFSEKKDLSTLDKWRSRDDRTEKHGKDTTFPCVELVRFKNIDMHDKRAEYFGPYPAGELLKKSMRYLRKIFPYRDCSVTKFATYKRRGRTCLYGDIGICPGPCLGEVLSVDYLENIKLFKQFLRGQKRKVITTLEKKMNKASKSRNFEEAASIRNQLKALYHLNEVALGIRDDFFDQRDDLFKRIECYDISNQPSGKETTEVVGSMVVFTDGEPNKSEYRRFKIKEVGESPNSDLARLKQVLERRFANEWPLPNLIIIDGGATHLKVAKEAIARYNLDIPVISISKGPKRQNNDFHFGDLKTAEYINHSQNLRNVAISARDEAHRFAISYSKALHRKEIFK